MDASEAKQRHCVKLSKFCARPHFDSVTKTQSVTFLGRDDFSLKLAALSLLQTVQLYLLLYYAFLPIQEVLTPLLIITRGDYQIPVVGVLTRIHLHGGNY
jgi:hypothetical protein